MSGPNRKNFSIFCCSEWAWGSDLVAWPAQNAKKEWHFGFFYLFPYTLLQNKLFEALSFMMDHFYETILKTSRKWRNAQTCFYFQLYSKTEVKLFFRYKHLFYVHLFYKECPSYLEQTSLHLNFSNIISHKQQVSIETCKQEMVLAWYTFQLLSL